MEIVTTICYAALAISAILCALRVMRGPSLPDRVLAVDTLLTTGAVGVAVEAARTRSGVYLDVLLVVALVAFVGTVAVARFIERRGAQ
ncbi:MAG TPA: monovalent cation/H+ antiporter complex subunit F [Bryobacteraceae bacterium]|nr:monovalent cation/H+ antiporter complex subunit F [Bryobacteraceae bacterium]HPQ14499.1 monovalent cation/H+ antiporter complex subunit F [Bryobacteraceae bacterium]